MTTVVITGPLQAQLLLEEIANAGPTAQATAQFNLGISAGVPVTTNDSVAAAGTNQAGATALMAARNTIVSGGSLAGVRTDNLVAGGSVLVMNRSGQPQYIYPAIGAQIEGLGANIPIEVASGANVTLIGMSGTNARII